MTIGRLHYDGGGDWYANPSSLPNLLTALRTRTGLRVAPEEKVVTLADDDLWNVPYIYMTGHGNVHWSDEDLAHAAPISASRADSSTPTTTTAWTRRSGASSAGCFPIIRWSRCRSIIRSTIWSTTFPKGIPKIHVHDGKPAQGFGIFLDGRLAVYYSYQIDLGDGWEDPEVHHDPPEKQRGGAPHGGEPVRLRGGVRRVTALATHQALHHLARPLGSRAMAGLDRAGDWALPRCCWALVPGWSGSVGSTRPTGCWLAWGSPLLGAWPASRYLAWRNQRRLTRAVLAAGWRTSVPGGGERLTGAARQLGVGHQRRAARSWPTAPRRTRSAARAVARWSRMARPVRPLAAGSSACSLVGILAFSSAGPVNGVRGCALVPAARLGGHRGSGAAAGRAIWSTAATRPSSSWRPSAAARRHTVAPLAWRRAGSLGGSARFARPGNGHHPPLRAICSPG